MDPTNPASLENLHDLWEPAPISWWPPAPGWYLVAFVALASILWVARSAWRRWQANRYRRAALADLQRLQLSLDDETQQTVVSEALPELLKRVALAGWPRTEVAAISGEAWTDFLNATNRSSVLDPQQRRVLCEVAYDVQFASSLSREQTEILFRAARAWIKTHNPARPWQKGAG